VFSNGKLEDINFDNCARSMGPCELIKGESSWMNLILYVLLAIFFFVLNIVMFIIIFRGAKKEVKARRLNRPIPLDQDQTLSTENQEKYVGL
ncbi:hypothetical protein PMAYCL1PPCAC_21423, partial [Pristionchus mayeri]